MLRALWFCGRNLLTKPSPQISLSPSGSNFEIGLHRVDQAGLELILWPWQASRVSLLSSWNYLAPGFLHHCTFHTAQAAGLPSLSSLFFFCMWFILCAMVCVCVCLCVGYRTACGSRFFPSILWVQGVKQEVRLGGKRCPWSHFAIPRTVLPILSLIGSVAPR